MVGFVIVSHSEKLAGGVVELARMMAPDVPFAAAGGLAEGGLGTSFEKIRQAIEKVYSRDGVIVLTDMGSAVMTAEMVLEQLEGMDVHLADCPVVEGAVAGAVDASVGMGLREIVDDLEKTKSWKKMG